MLLLVSLPAEALVLAVGDSSTNRSAPADDPGWAFVGRLTREGSSVSTGMYLGNRWIIATEHSGRFDAIRLEGEDYAVVEGSRQRVTHESGAQTDLVLARIERAPPSEPEFEILQGNVQVGEPVLVIASGRNRRDDPVFWNLLWEEVEDRSQAVFGGVRWANNVKRWGTNRVDEVPAEMVRNLPVFTTMFNAGRQPRTPFEAQGATADSGGGAFVKREGRWYLAGIAVATSNFPNQPRNTSAFTLDGRAGNQTIFARISYFKDQIEALLRQP